MSPFTFLLLPLAALLLVIVVPLLPLDLQKFLEFLAGACGIIFFIFMACFLLSLCSAEGRAKAGNAVDSLVKKLQPDSHRK